MYPWGASESEGGGNQTHVKPAALMAAAFSWTTLYQLFLARVARSPTPAWDPQWNPCRRTSRPSPQYFLSSAGPRPPWGNGTTATHGILISVCMAVSTLELWV